MMDEITYDVVEVGEDWLPPTPTEIAPYKIQRYSYAVDDWDPISIPVREGCIGQAALCANDALAAYRTKYKGLSGLHAKHEMEILNPPRLGAKVTVTGRHVDKYVKRGIPYRVFEGQVVDENGVVYLRSRAHETCGAPSIGKAKGAPEEPVQRDVPTLVSDVQTPCVYERIPIGAQVTPMCKQITLEQIVAFTGMGHKNFHTDVEFARSLGLPNAIAQGMMSGCYVSELMTRFFGWGWRRGGRMSVYFINAVFAGDTLYVSGTVKEKVPEGDATRVVLDVWCENQSGKKTTVGTASGLVYKSE